MQSVSRFEEQSLKIVAEREATKPVLMSSIATSLYYDLREYKAGKSEKTLTSIFKEVEALGSEAALMQDYVPSMRTKQMDNTINYYNNLLEEMFPNRQV